MDNKNSFSFIHASDIHLGSNLSFKYTPKSQTKILMEQAVLEAFMKICSYAINYKVDFLLLSGDIYDLSSPSLRAGEIFVSQCEKLKEANIEVYVISGNHDAQGERKEFFTLPSNVHYLSCEGVDKYKYSRNGRELATIIGHSYKHRTLSSEVLKDYNVEDSNLFNIAMLHTSLIPSNNFYVPCTMKELMDVKNIHYWALGHNHGFSVLRRENPAVVYSGSPQGRNIKETGMGGCLLVEVEDKNIKKKVFLPTSSVIYKKANISIEALNLNVNKLDFNRIKEIILNECKNLSQKKLNEDFENISIAEGCDDLVKAYVVQWSVEIKSNYNSILKDINEEDVEVIIENINNSCSNLKPFVFTDLISFKTKVDTEEIEKIYKDNEIFKALSEVMTEIIEDNKVKGELIETWGKIWEGDRLSEEEQYEKFNADAEIYENIVNEAYALVLQNLFGNNK